MLAIAFVFAAALALAPREASANYMGSAAALAQTIPHQNLEKAYWVCRRGYYRRRCWWVRPYRRYYWRPYYRRYYWRPYRRFYWRRW
jgi:hypothetical protein